MATKMTREEALNKVRQMSLPKETMEILEALAPELAESKDERIRRKMIEHFKAKTKETWCNMPVKDIIAYLEKQKEQKLFMANSPQLKEQKPGEIPPYVTGIKGDPDPAGVWKPSEEQMEALNEIVNILEASPFLHQNDYLFNILNGLREELKNYFNHEIH